jgi:ABC-type glycerol-3-phosphate transport system permease component
VGGFLLSLKTFILIKLKENVYDHEEYRKIFNDQKQLDSSLLLYGPLRNLSDFLFWSVLSTIGAAIAQLTIGLFGSYWLTLASLWLSVFALSILVVSLILIKSSLNDWFDFINHTNC